LFLYSHQSFVAVPAVPPYHHSDRPSQPAAELPEVVVLTGPYSLQENRRSQRLKKLQRDSQTGGPKGRLPNSQRDSQAYKQWDSPAYNQSDSQAYSQKDSQAYSQSDSQAYNQRENQAYSQRDSQAYSQKDSQAYSQKDSPAYSQKNSQAYSQKDSPAYSHTGSQNYQQEENQEDNTSDLWGNIKEEDFQEFVTQNIQGINSEDIFEVDEKHSQKVNQEERQKKDVSRNDIQEVNKEDVKKVIQKAVLFADLIRQATGQKQTTREPLFTSSFPETESEYLAERADQPVVTSQTVWPENSAQVREAQELNKLAVVTTTDSGQPPANYRFTSRITKPFVVADQSTGGFSSTSAKRFSEKHSSSTVGTVSEERKKEAAPKGKIKKDEQVLFNRY
jgi:hypothetical protein